MSVAWQRHVGGLLGMVYPELRCTQHDEKGSTLLVILVVAVLNIKARFRVGHMEVGQGGVGAVFISSRMMFQINKNVHFGGMGMKAHPRPHPRRSFPPMAIVFVPKETHADTTEGKPPHRVGGCW